MEFLSQIPGVGLLSYIIIPTSSKKTNMPTRVLPKPMYQLIRIIQHILIARMRTILKHLDLNGIKKLTFTHLTCV